MTTGLNIADLVKDCMNSIKDEMRNMKHANIIIAGKSGVGKSTLINAVFREPMAQTGVGRPVTQHINLLEREDMPLRIYDTWGLELDETSRIQLKKDIKKIISDRLAMGDPDHYIHAIWYVINTMSNRFEEEEINFIRDLAEAERSVAPVPIILVLSQSLSEEQTQLLMHAILSEQLPIYDIIPVLAADYPLQDELVLKSFGLDHLIQTTYKLLPEAAGQAFINAQKIDWTLKREQARKVITATAAAVFGIGAAPIPGADAPLMIAAQTTMLAKITVSYGLAVDKATMSTVLSSVLGTSAATLVGRTVAGSLLKVVPIGGAIVGGAISGVTGATLTYALGETYIRVLEGILSGEWTQENLKGKSGRRRIGKLFKDTLKSVKKQKGATARQNNNRKFKHIPQPIPIPQQGQPMPHGQSNIQWHQPPQETPNDLGQRTTQGFPNFQEQQPPSKQPPSTDSESPPIQPHSLDPPCD
ncbi:MAG: GTPase [Fastidiosipilaceae bacterium]|jgi:uncharacterized protein (DUF697 family)/GTP-binding protein EngB required for normal cell division